MNCSKAEYPRQSTHRRAWSMALGLASSLAPAGLPPGPCRSRRLTVDPEPVEHRDCGDKATTRRQNPQLRAFHQPFNCHGMAPPGRRLGLAAIIPKGAPSAINPSGERVVFKGGVIRIGSIFNPRSWASCPTQPPSFADDGHAGRAEGPSRSTADLALLRPSAYRSCSWLKI